MIARDLREAIDLPGPGPELRCTEANRDEAKKLTQLDPRLTRMELDRRFTEGQICHIWWVDERIVHLRWFTDRRAFLPFLGLTFRPQDGDYLLYEVFTRADRRVRGIHSLVAGASLRRARDLGYRRMVALCAWWNTPALKVGWKTGFRSVGTITAWQLGPNRLFTNSGEVSVRGTEMSVKGAVKGARHISSVERICP